MGGDTAATEYFKRTSSANLTAAFSPIVDRAMQRVGVVQQYNNVLASAPGGSALAGQFDLNKYVVGKTLDGLFLMLGEEEKKIRKDPAAQTTSLLKEVFGRSNFRFPRCLRRLNRTIEAGVKVRTLRRLSERGPRLDRSPRSKPIVSF